MTPANILIIEDHPVNRELFSQVLEASGYGVLQAENATIGIAMARAELPALILMDMSLPGMNGFDATRRLKHDPLTTAIPIIAVTAHAFAKDRAAALSAGCISFMSKPIDIIFMIAEIRRILEATVENIVP